MGDLRVTPQVVMVRGTRLVRGEPIKGKVPHWHRPYYDCPHCGDDVPCDQVAFNLADGTTTEFLVTDELLLWGRSGWPPPRGTALLKLVGSSPCERGRHLYWQWRFLDEAELSLLGSPDEDARHHE